MKDNIRKQTCKIHRMRIYSSCILLLTITMVFLITGCSNASNANSVSEANTKQEQNSTSAVVSAATVTQSTQATQSTGMNKIGLYIQNKDAGTHDLITEYISKWEKGKDIECFEAFTTDVKSISGYPFSKAWEPYWKSFDNADSYKIGYCLTFTANVFDATTGTSSVKTISKTIKTPTDTEQYKEYIELYIYDDVHQTPGVWYTHLSESDIKDNTYMTSIKLTAGTKIADVSNIKLSAFTYSSDKEFDSKTGNYIGNNSYQISVKRSE